MDDPGTVVAWSCPEPGCQHRINASREPSADEGAMNERAVSKLIEGHYNERHRTGVFLVISSAGELHSTTLDLATASRRAQSIGGLWVPLVAGYDFRPDGKRVSSAPFLSPSST